MPSLLSRLGLSRSARPSGVRDRLNHERNLGRRITLVPISASSSRDTSFTTEIIAVDDSCLIVAKPTSRGGRARRIGHLESFQLSVATEDGELRGTTRNLGRAKANSNDGEVRGYRLAIPSELRPHRMQRSLHESPDDAIFEASLHLISRKCPIRGVVEDISPRGARLRCRNGQDLVRGASAYLKLSLPAPVGKVQEIVHIVELESSGDVVRARLLFERPHAGIKAAMLKSKFWPRRTVLRSR